MSAEKQTTPGPPRLRLLAVLIGLGIPLGLTTPLHFLGGTPDIPAFFMVTVFTDFATAFAVLLFAVWIGRIEDTGVATA